MSSPKNEDVAMGSPQKSEVSRASASRSPVPRTSEVPGSPVSEASPLAELDKSPANSMPGSPVTPADSPQLKPLLEPPNGAGGRTVSRSRSPQRGDKKESGPPRIRLGHQYMESLQKAAAPVENLLEHFSKPASISAEAMASRYPAPTEEPTDVPLSGQALQKSLETRAQDDTYKKIAAAREELDIVKIRAKILGNIMKNQVVFISGASGSGKSSQVPQYIYDSSAAKARIVVVTNTRIAAIAIATKVAYERLEEVGAKAVGYSVKNDERVCDRTRINFMTTEILQRRILADPNLQGISHLIFDDVQERDWQMDTQLVYVNRLLKKKPHLKVILMGTGKGIEDLQSKFDEGTLVQLPNAGHKPKQLFLEHVAMALLKNPTLKKRLGAGILSGDVDMEDDKFKELSLECTKRKRRLGIIATNVGDELPPEDDLGFPAELTEKIDLNAKVSKAFVTKGIARHDMMQQIWGLETDYDILVGLVLHLHGMHQQVAAAALQQKQPAPNPATILIYLPCVQDIDRVRGLLRRVMDENFVWFLPMHDGIRLEQQRQIFNPAPKGTRKIILADSLADAAVTCPDAEYVIDCGRIEQEIYDPDLRATITKTNWISKELAAVRLSRCAVIKGKENKGMCFHLFSQKRYSQMDDQSKVEIQNCYLGAPSLWAKLFQLHLQSQETLADLFRDMAAPPNPKSVENAVHDLKQATIFTENEELTPMGWHLLSMPLDIDAGRAVLWAILLGVFDDVLAIFGSKDCRNPFLQDPSQKDKVDKAKEKFMVAGCNSDQVTLLNAFRKFQEAKIIKQGEQFCATNGLNERRLGSIHEQMARLQRDLRDKVIPAHTVSFANRNMGNSQVLQAILGAALYPQIAVRKREEGDRRRGKNALDGYRMLEGSTEAAIHSTSCYRGKGDADYYVAFQDIIEVNGGFEIDQCAEVRPLMIALLAGKEFHLKPHPTDPSMRVIELDGGSEKNDWMVFAVDSKIGEDIQNARKSLQAIMISYCQTQTLPQEHVDVLDSLVGTFVTFKKKKEEPEVQKGILGQRSAKKDNRGSDRGRGNRGRGGKDKRSPKKDTHWREAKAAEDAHRKTVQKQHEDEINAKMAALRSQGMAQVVIDQQVDELRGKHLANMQQQMAEFRLAQDADLRTEDRTNAEMQAHVAGLMARKAAEQARDSGAAKAEVPKVVHENQPLPQNEPIAQNEVVQEVANPVAEVKEPVEKVSNPVSVGGSSNPFSAVMGLFSSNKSPATASGSQDRDVPMKNQEVVGVSDTTKEEKQTIEVEEEKKQEEVEEKSIPPVPKLPSQKASSTDKSEPPLPDFSSITRQELNSLGADKPVPQMPGFLLAGLKAETKSLNEDKQKVTEEKAVEAQHAESTQESIDIDKDSDQVVDLCSPLIVPQPNPSIKPADDLAALEKEFQEEKKALSERHADKDRSNFQKALQLPKVASPVQAQKKDADEEGETKTEPMVLPILKVIAPTGEQTPVVTPGTATPGTLLLPPGMVSPAASIASIASSCNSEKELNCVLDDLVVVDVVESSPIPTVNSNASLRLGIPEFNKQGSPKAISLVEDLVDSDDDESVVGIASPHHERSPERGPARLVVDVDPAPSSDPRTMLLGPLIGSPKGADAATMVRNMVPLGVPQSHRDAVSSMMSNFAVPHGKGGSKGGQPWGGNVPGLTGNPIVDQRNKEAFEKHQRQLAHIRSINQAQQMLHAQALANQQRAFAKQQNFAGSQEILRSTSSGSSLSTLGSGGKAGGKPTLMKQYSFGLQNEIPETPEQLVANAFRQPQTPPSAHTKKSVDSNSSAFSPKEHNLTFSANNTPAEKEGCVNLTFTGRNAADGKTRQPSPKTSGTSSSSILGQMINERVQAGALGSKPMSLAQIAGQAAASKLSALFSPKAKTATTSVEVVYGKEKTPWTKDGSATPPPTKTIPITLPSVSPTSKIPGISRRGQMSPRAGTPIPRKLPPLSSPPSSPCKPVLLAQFKSPVNAGSPTALGGKRSWASIPLSRSAPSTPVGGSPATPVKKLLLSSVSSPVLTPMPTPKRSAPPVSKPTHCLGVAPLDKDTRVAPVGSGSRSLGDQYDAELQMYKQGSRLSGFKPCLPPSSDNGLANPLAATGLERPQDKPPELPSYENIMKINQVDARKNPRASDDEDDELARSECTSEVGAPSATGSVGSEGDKVHLGHGSTGAIVFASRLASAIAHSNSHRTGTKKKAKKDRSTIPPSFPKSSKSPLGTPVNNPEHDGSAQNTPASTRANPRKVLGAPMSGVLGKELTMPYASGILGKELTLPSSVHGVALGLSTNPNISTSNNSKRKGGVRTPTRELSPNTSSIKRTKTISRE